MSAVSRRQVLGGVALAGAAGALSMHKFAGREKVAQAVIFDSRKPLSLAFAKAQQGIRLVDLAGEERGNWSGVRSLRRGAPVAGLTGWTDYVAARGWLEERGLRLVSERHDRKRNLTEWRMA